MEVLMYIGMFVISLAVLLRASDWFIDSAENIGLTLGISPFIIGVTIVAFGTSLPELATSIAAIYAGNSEIVVGNVVGSNITNIALVLGLVAVMVGRIELENNIWHIDMPYLWASAFLLWFTLYDLHFSMGEAILFLVGITVFLAYSVSGNGEKIEVEHRAGWRSYAFLVLGGGLVWLSADYTILAISKLSTLAGISPEVIALSAVALGTSLPEVIVSLSAARKGKSSIAVGTVLGSNIFNTYAVMGIPALFGKLVIPETIVDFSLPFMLAVTFLFAILCMTHRISKSEGILLLVLYAFFLIKLTANA